MKTVGFMPGNPFRRSAQAHYSAGTPPWEQWPSASQLRLNDRFGCLRDLRCGARRAEDLAGGIGALEKQHELISETAGIARADGFAQRQQARSQLPLIRRGDGAAGMLGLRKLD